MVSLAAIGQSAINNGESLLRGSSGSVTNISETSLKTNVGYLNSMW
jgi:hypothetical protein